MSDPRFAVDAMLGRLARWLRALGFDATYDAALEDAVLVRRADEEGRVLLTRDRHLLRELKPLQALEIREDAPLAQLGHVVDALRLQPPAQLFTRCMLCNSLLAQVPVSEAAQLVPPEAMAVPGPVLRCPDCARVYWHGSHVRRMRTALERALPGWLPPLGAPTP